MTTVQRKGINKVYPDGFLAVPDLDLVIHEGGGDDDGRSCRRDQPRVHLTVRSADGALGQPGQHLRGPVSWLEPSLSTDMLKQDYPAPGASAGIPAFCAAMAWRAS